MRNFPNKNILTAGILLALSQMAVATAQAADVPQGTVLAAKQEIIRGNGGEVQSLDPHKIEGSPESYVSYDLLEGLAIVDPQGKVVPGVAQSWENKDATVWTFHLRKNALWSNGQPVTAQDFVYSWRRLVNPKTASPYASYLAYGHVVNVDDIVAGKKSPDQLGVKALDDHTLQVTLSKPVPFFDQLLVYPALSPVYPPVVEKYGDQWTLPKNWVGNGAYTLQDHIVNERIVVVRNPKYWNNAATVINKVTFLPIDSEVTDVNRFYSDGGSDMSYNNLPIELFRKLKKDNPQDLRVTPYLCTYFYELNNKKPPFNDARIRTAFKLGLDRDIIVNKVLAQGQTPAYSLTDPATHGIDVAKPDWYKLTQTQRNAEAKKLLQEAGYGPDHPLTIELLYNTSDLHKKLAIAAASIWKKNLGVNVQLVNQEWKTYLDSRHQGTYQMARAGWCGDYNEPSAFLNTMQTGDSNNTAFYSSAAFDQALKDASNATDSGQRASDYQKAEQILDKDSAIVPVFYYASTRLVKPYVGGFTGNDPLDHIYDKNLYIIKH